MAAKNVISPTLVTAANQSLAANFTSIPTVIKYMDNASYQINVYTTNSVGSFVVEASLDYQENNLNVVNGPAGNWVQLTLSGSPSVVSANDSILISMNQLPFNAIRLRYTSSTAGTGTCAVYVMTKQIG